MKVRYGLAILLIFISSNAEAAKPAASVPPNSLRVAAIQMAITADMDTNLARILRGIGEAAEKNARLVLFPETALSGFDRETIQQLEWERIEQAMETVAACAKKHDLYVLYGCATQSNKERPYNSAVLICEVDLSRAMDDNHLKDRRSELYRAITERK